MTNDGGVVLRLGRDHVVRELVDAAVEGDGSDVDGGEGDVFEGFGDVGWDGAFDVGDVAGCVEQGKAFQALLPAEGYAVGEYTIADAAITPFFARANVALKNDIGAYDAGEGVRVYNILQSDSKFARFRKYYEDVTARDSFKETFHEVNSVHHSTSSAVLTPCLRRRSILKQFSRVDGLTFGPNGWPLHKLDQGYTPRSLECRVHSVG